MARAGRKTQAQRRRKSAHAAVRKGATLMQPGLGPRAQAGAKRPNVKKG